MPLQPKKSFVRFVCFFVCLIAMLQACSTGRSKRSAVEALKDHPGSESFKESQKAFSDRNPIIVSHIGELELTIRMATTAEIPEDNHKMWLLFSAEGAGSLALGLLAPTLFSSALVVGGIFLIPAGTYGYLHEKGIWDSINGALNNAEFTRAVDKAIRKRLIGSLTKESAPNVKIEIIILGFGIIKSSAMNRHCLVVSADFIVSRDSIEVKRDNIKITDDIRSEDAPPPQCTRLEHFAKNEARLVKDTLAEYAEVLAVMAINRITGGNAK